MNGYQTNDFEPKYTPRAAFLAWLWPGLGHISLGERKRGFLIMAGILMLIACGLLVGGVDAVDRKSDRLWFYAQAVNGPLVFGLDFINQNYVKQLPPEQQLRTTGLGKVNEMGILFIALAGLMNLIVIMDALFHHPHKLVQSQSTPELSPADSAESKASTPGNSEANPGVNSGGSSGGYSGGESGGEVA